MAKAQDLRILGMEKGLQSSSGATSPIELSQGLFSGINHSHSPRVSQWHLPLHAFLEPEAEKPYRGSSARSAGAGVLILSSFHLLLFGASLLPLCIIFDAQITEPFRTYSSMWQGAPFPGVAHAHQEQFCSSTSPLRTSLGPVILKLISAYTSVYMGGLLPMSFHIP